MHPVVGMRSPPLSLIHVEDLVEILLRVADSGCRIAKDVRDRPGQGYYFACRPEYPNYVEWGAMVKSALQRPLAPTIPLVGPLPWIAAGVNELIARFRGRPDSFNLDKIREAKAPSWACSCRAVARDFGFEPTKSLSERTRETVAWYRQHGWL